MLQLHEKLCSYNKQEVFNYNSEDSEIARIEHIPPYVDLNEKEGKSKSSAG